MPRIDDLIDLLIRESPTPDGLDTTPGRGDDARTILLRRALCRHERSGPLLDEWGELAPAARNSAESLLSIGLLRELVAASLRRCLDRLAPGDRGVLSGSVREIARAYAARDLVSLRVELFAAIDRLAQCTLDTVSSALLLAYRFSLESDLRLAWPSYARFTPAMIEFHELEGALVHSSGERCARAVDSLFALLAAGPAEASPSLRENEHAEERAWRRWSSTLTG